MKCDICGSEIKTGIMEKIRGTYIKTSKKKYAICSSCQKEGESALKEKIGKRI